MTDGAKHQPHPGHDEHDDEHDVLAVIGAEDAVERPGEAAEDESASPASDADAPAPG